MLHKRVGIEYKTIKKHELPYRLQNLMHDCGEYVPGPIINRGPPMCYGCNKVVPWFFYKCVVCETYFVRDFRHPKFCYAYPTCWEHTLTLEWEWCPDHCYRPNYQSNPNDSRYSLYIEPVGLNPKVLSKEEVASFDIFADF